MKKALVIFLLLIYGFSSTGMTLQLHYCCGKLKNIELVPSHNNSCDHGSGKAMTKNCCESKSLDGKLKDVYQSQQLPSFFLKNLDVKPATFQIQLLSAPAVNESFASYDSSPSPPLNQSLYIVNRVFRL